MQRERVPEGTVQDVLDHVVPYGDVITGMANGEAVEALDLLEREHERLTDVRVFQMHALRPRLYIDGRCGDHLRHVSLFLSPATRAACWSGACDLLASDFSNVPRALRRHTNLSLIVAAASPPDADGWCTLGTNAEYVAPLRGEAPLVLEVNERMPRTHGNHRVHLSEVAAWYRTDRPLVALEPARPDDRDRAIGAFVADRIQHGATLQIGIGSVPEAVLDALSGHRDLGVHTELFSDGLMQLVERGVVTGGEKRQHPGVAVATFALGSQRLYDWLDDNPAVELHPVDWVNDPRTIATERRMVSVNATTEVDFFGQCASETMAGRLWSGSGGQADFARGAIASSEGEAFVVLHSTTSDGRSRIRPTLTDGSIVTTSKNDVDHVVTEWGVATLRGRTVAERTRALIAVAHPSHREWLKEEAEGRGALGPRPVAAG
ncbi:acetyl-CoA hydrolase/transferase family protein [Patulibacter americanus]|uniref:acetyl-CoA hydrolase/transferase family protein n=1 Tax=Patulibacter americanus TaxID=588672 RepID=UPI0003B34555|nr:acetyl-CoA hydrolase/transferase C-terminal domain-containing protein [Patulibacter americanus]